MAQSRRATHVAFDVLQRRCHAANLLRFERRVRRRTTLSASRANERERERRRAPARFEERKRRVASRRARTNSHPPIERMYHTTSINQSLVFVVPPPVARRDNLARDACVDAARVGVSRARAMDARILDASVRLERVERLVRAVNDGGCRRGGCLSPRRGRRVRARAVRRERGRRAGITGDEEHRVG